jgi:hypothetical protein
MKAAFESTSASLKSVVNRKAEDFAVPLKALVEDNYTQVDFNVAFKSPNTIGNMFSFKDRIRYIDHMLTY